MVCVYVKFHGIRMGRQMFVSTSMEIVDGHNEENPTESSRPYLSKTADSGQIICYLGYLFPFYYGWDYCSQQIYSRRKLLR